MKMTSLITKVASSIAAGMRAPKLFPYPALKSKMEENLEGAIEAKFIKEQKEAKKARQ